MARPMSDDEFERALMQMLHDDTEAGTDAEFGSSEAGDRAAEDEPLDADAESSDAADLVAMRQALGSYREQSLGWAQQRSAAMPPPLPPRQTGWLAAPQWALGTAAFCACVVGAALYTHHQAVLTQQAAAVLPAAPTQQALAVDNQLLSSVDSALRGSVAPTEQELGLTEELSSERAQKRHAAQQRAN